MPGMLGSVLYYRREPDDLELWGENLLENYRRLCDQPSTLDWLQNARPASSRLLKSIRTSRCLPFVKSTIYEKLAACARGLPDISRVIECSYDWRDSVLNSCGNVTNTVRQSLSTDLDKPARAGEQKLVFLAHSLGGLVVKSAVAKGLIHPSRIDRIVYIGSPLYGAPAAFRSMYSEVTLPLFLNSRLCSEPWKKINLERHFSVRFAHFHRLCNYYRPHTLITSVTALFREPIR